MHFIVIVRIKRDIPTIHSQIKRVQAWMRQRFTTRSRKSLDREARNGYDRVGSASPPPYEERPPNQGNAVELGDPEYERACEDIWPGQGVKE